MGMCKGKMLIFLILWTTYNNSPKFQIDIYTFLDLFAENIAINKP